MPKYYRFHKTAFSRAWEIPVPSNTVTVPWVYESTPKRHAFRSIYWFFAGLTLVTVQQTDKYTDHATCVAVDRIPCCAVWCDQKVTLQNLPDSPVYMIYVRRRLCAFSCLFANLQSKRRLKLFVVLVSSSFDSIFKLLNITLVASSNANKVEDIDLGQVWACPSITP